MSIRARHFFRIGGIAMNGTMWRPVLSGLPRATSRGLSRATSRGRRPVRRAPWLAVMGVVACAALVSAQRGTTNGEWPTYGGDLGNTKYAPLDQITAANFNSLEIAWRFKTDNLGPRPEFQYEGTPLMVKGVVYSTGGTRRAVVALDAATGEQLWVH